MWGTTGSSRFSKRATLKKKKMVENNRSKVRNFDCQDPVSEISDHRRSVVKRYLAAKV